MRGVDEGADVVGHAVEPRRRPEVDAVVAPAEPAGELVQRHDLEERDADVAQQRELLDRRTKGAFGRERADVHLVDDELFERRILASPSMH